MKNLIYLFIGLVAGLAPTQAAELDGATNRPYRYDGSKYIFVGSTVMFNYSNTVTPNARNTGQFGTQRKTDPSACVC